jgi:hypothetical protein
MEAPNFRNSSYPGEGEKIGPFWRAAWDVLGDGEWRHAKRLSEELSPRFGILPATGKGVLRAAVKAEVLEREYRGVEKSAWVRRVIE